MIKLKIASDLHLESCRDFPDLGYGEVLILAGDIIQYSGVNSYVFDRYNEFFWDLSARYRLIIVVAGNHEFYQGTFPDNYKSIRWFYDQFPNIVFLQNDFVDYKGVRFLGGTLWTSCNNADPIAIQRIATAMNDYRLIGLSGERLRLYPSYLLTEHIQTLEFISENITDNSVVITHHAPHELSIDSKYKHDFPINYAYFSDLSRFIEETKPKIWVHGHMHSCSDYTIGNTRVLANPRGYPGENPQFNMNGVINV